LIGLNAALFGTVLEDQRFTIAFIRNIPQFGWKGLPTSFLVAVKVIFLRVKCRGLRRHAVSFGNAIAQIFPS
jgi:hypothetical protein